MNIFFIDPQSYNNLAIYDYNILKYNDKFNITFFGNSQYSYKPLKTSKFSPIFKYSNKRGKIIKLLSYSISIFIIFIQILKKKPQLIHIEWIKTWEIDYTYLKILKLITKTKILYTAHNILPHESGNKLFDKYHKLYHLVDHIITHTYSSKEELITKFNLPQANITVIAHGILRYDLSSTQVQEIQNSIKNKFSITDQIIFLSLGKQSTYKGSDLIAKVWANTPEFHNPKYKLIIVGKNDNIDFELLKGINNVHIENRFVSDEEIAAFLKIGHVMLLPYRIISQSGVLLTSFSERIPVIVSSAGGIAESLNIGDIGWNIGEASFENLKKILIELTNNPNEIIYKKNNIIEWEKIEKYYSWEILARQTYNLYNKLII